MTCEIELLTMPIRASSSSHKKAKAKLAIISRVRATVKSITGAKAASVLLCSIILVSSRVLPGTICQIDVISEISAQDIYFNFITLDDHYVMTEDGKIFFVIDN